MKLTNQLILLLALSLSFASCKKDITNKIFGNISDAGGQTIYIDQLSFDNSMLTVAQTELDASGGFDIDLKEPLEGGAYRARIGNKSLPFVTDGSEFHLSVNGTLEEIGAFNSKVESNANTMLLLEKIGYFQKKEIGLKDITTFITTEADPLVGMQLSMMIFGGNDKYVAVYKAVSDRLNTSYPTLKTTKAYETYVNAVSKTYNRRMSSEKIKVGMDAPDIILKDPQGKTRKLSDLKGKVVLIDFWASWCGPCRRANPEVVAIYNKYKSKGFDVFSVSLDGLDNKTKARLKDDTKINAKIESSKKRWVAAITKDNLTWDNHVSDLKKWDSSPASLYGVRSIPKTFLINREGVIISTNTRGSLEEQILKTL